jgi:hypothetical protein
MIKTRPNHSSAPAAQQQAIQHLIQNSPINNQAMNKSLLSFKQEATSKQAAYLIINRVSSLFHLTPSPSFTSSLPT